MPSMTALDDLVSLLDGATERRDRLAAIELVEPASASTSA